MGSNYPDRVDTGYAYTVRPGTRSAIESDRVQVSHSKEVADLDGATGPRAQSWSDHADADVSAVPDDEVIEQLDPQLDQDGR